MSQNRHCGAPLGPLRREQLDDVPAAIEALRAHRDHPDAYSEAVRLVDALDDCVAACSPGDWSAWSAVAEAAEAALQEIEAWHLGRLGLRRVEARGEAGAAPQGPQPVTVMAQGPRRRGGRCWRAWSAPECDGRRWRSP